MQEASLGAVNVNGLGLVALFFGLIGYLAPNRFRLLHRYRREILVAGVLLFLVGIYINRQAFMAGFMDGWNLGRRNR